MLVLARIRAGRYELKRELVSPFQLLSLSCSAHVGEHETLVEKHDADGLRLKADPDALLMIFDNLISNALKFSSDDAQIDISLFQDGDDIRFEITNDGPLVDAEVLSVASNAFVSHDMSYSRNAQGVGLGLAIVKGLVNLHDGNFSLTSRSDVGTIASVWLPSGLAENQNMFELI